MRIVLYEVDVYFPLKVVSCKSLLIAVPDEDSVGSADEGLWFTLCVEFDPTREAV